MSELRGLQMEVILTTYKSWNDPPAKKGWVFYFRNAIVGSLVATLSLFGTYKICFIHNPGDERDILGNFAA